MVARLRDLAASLGEAGLEFEADALEEMADAMEQATNELAGANASLKRIVPRSVAEDIRVVLSRHGLVPTTPVEDGAEEGE